MTARRRPTLAVTGAAIVALVIAAGPAGGQTATTQPRRGDPAKVSRYYPPLQEADAGIKDIAARMGKLRPVGTAEGDAAAVKAVGGELLAEAEKLRKTVDAFLKGETRRGLSAELALIRNGTARLTSTRKQLHYLSSVRIPMVEQKDFYEELRLAAIRLVRLKILRQLARNGVEELLTEGSFKAVYDKATQWAVQEVDGHIQDIAARVSMLNLANLKAMVQAQIPTLRGYVRSTVFKLAVRITSNEFVIGVITQVGMRFLTEELWPKVKEALRHKGHLEERTERSVGTMEQSMLELDSLGTRTGPDGKLVMDAGSVKLNDVRKAIDRAYGRIHAARYLYKDLASAQKAEPRGKLSAAEKKLREKIQRTEFRFMLDREDEIESVEDRLAILEAEVATIRKILELVDKPGNALVDKEFFVYHAAQPASEKLIYADRPTQPLGSHNAAVKPELRYLDLREVAERRMRHEASTRKDKGEFNRYAYSRQYLGTHLMAIECAGLKKYYLRQAAGNRSSTYGVPVFCGVGNGQHPVSVTIHSPEGFLLSFKYTVEVKVEPNKQVEAAARNAAKNVESARKSYTEADTPERKKSAGNRLLDWLLNHATFTLRGPNGSPANVEPILKEALEVDEAIGGTRWLRVKHEGAFASMCSDLGTPGAYELARRLAARRTAEGIGAVRMRSIYHALAQMAITTGNDVEAARGWLQKAADINEYYQKKPEALREAKAHWPVKVETRQATPETMTPQVGGEKPEAAPKD